MAGGAADSLRALSRWISRCAVAVALGWSRPPITAHSSAPNRAQGTRGD